MADQVLPFIEVSPVKQRTIWEPLATSTPFLQTTDHEHSNLTMVSCLFPCVTFAPKDI